MKRALGNILCDLDPGQDQIMYFLVKSSSP